MTGNPATLRRPLERRHLQPDRDAGAANAKIAGVSASALLGLFIASLLIPVEPQVAGVRLTPYGLLQLVFVVPLLVRFFADRTNRIIPLDVFMALYVLWIGVAIYENHGPARAVFIVNQSITLYGGYLIGRVLIRNAASYRLFFTYFFYGLLIFLPFAVIELLTRHMLISELLGKIAPVHARGGQAPRLGLHRVQAFYEHSIGYGLFCSVGLANLFYIHRDELAKRLSRTGLIAFMTFISLSSAPVIAMGLQGVLIAWDSTMKLFAYRWYVLIGVSAFLLAFAQLTLEHGIVGFVIENLAFDPSTGWGRTEVFEYGSAEVLRHPTFGIGLGEWVRPWWRKSSVDNFWLLTAMRYGLPALLFLWAALAIHAMQIVGQRRLSDTAASYRRGYLIAWVGIIFVLGTVHIWGAVAVLIMAYIGAGAWFYTGTDGDAPDRGRDPLDRGQIERRAPTPPRETRPKGLAARALPSASPSATSPSPAPSSVVRSNPTRTGRPNS